MDIGRDIAIHLVGIPHVAVPAEGVFPAKGYVLVTMLMVASSRRMSRQAIAALLWDDAPEDKALTNLRQLLVRIHRCWPLEEPLVETSGPHLTAGPGAERSDLAVILALQKSQVLAEKVQSIALAKGDLLESIDMGGGELSQWFRGERERFRRMVLARAGEVLLEMTRFGRAQERDIDSIGERMLALEPEREESYRALIEAYGRNGNLDAANRMYTNLTTMLRREFNSDPRPETAAMMRRILANAPRPRLQILSQGSEIEVPPDVSRSEREISAVRSLAGLPRVALFPPDPAPEQRLHPLHRALIEDVANDLSRHRTFAVVAPHSSFGVADEPDSERMAALRSGYLITGFMMPDGEQMALRLVKQPADEIIWAAEYPVGIAKLATAFRMISHQISTTLAGEIERDQLERMRVDPKPGAYRHYLEGQIRLKNCDLPKLRRARSEFRQAISEDRYFAPSYARIAQTLQLEWLMLGGTDPYLLHQARREAETSISIDAGNGDGHWMAAVVALYQHDFDYSAEKFLEAEALNPHSADLLSHHADALSHLGDADAGWERFQRALELNPFPPDYYWWFGCTIAIRRKDFATGIELCKNMSSDESVLRVLAMCHGLMGNVEVARQYGRRLREMYPGATALEMARLAPDRRLEDIDLCAEGLRIAGLD